MSTDKKKCPDDGACHHGCARLCFRVQFCGPLSGVYPDDRWPEEIKTEYSQRIVEGLDGNPYYCEHPESEPCFTEDPANDCANHVRAPDEGWYL